MQITKQSALTGIVHTMELDVTEEQLFLFERGVLAHRVFPHLSAEEREFLITGITPQEWDMYIDLGGANEEDK